MANIYKGFSTIGKVRAPFTLIDGELIKTDLLNELKARKGERVMRPNFGTTVYDILMNPLDEFVIEEVREEVRRVIEKDPRVEIDEIFTQTQDHLIRVQVQLKYFQEQDQMISPKKLLQVLESYLSEEGNFILQFIIPTKK